MLAGGWQRHYGLRRAKATVNYCRPARTYCALSRTNREDSMPRYIIERSLPAMPPEALQELAKRSIQVADTMPGVVWIKSYISESEGKTYCEYEAPNPEALLEHARRLGISADRVTLISAEVNPAMFR